MKCPHCSVGVSFEWEGESPHGDPDFEVTSRGRQIVHADCPECGRMVAMLQVGVCDKRDCDDGTCFFSMEQVESEELIYPRSTTRPLPAEVPTAYGADYLESSQVLLASPKASAALSRRLLQKVLREHFSIKATSLDKEIDAFLGRPDLPSYLSETVDAVRVVGNFAAHPLKDTNTGEIVDVEPGEADWLLEVLDALFDYAFVQPQKLKARRDALNAKLRSLGKPPMKQGS